MPDPHVAYPHGVYRRATCWRKGCDALVPLAQDDRFRGVYCEPCQQLVRADAERAAGMEGDG